MTLNVALKITGDAESAKRALDDTARAAENLGKKIEGLSTGQMKVFETMARRAGVTLEEMVERVRRTSAGLNPAVEAFKAANDNAGGLSKTLQDVAKNGGAAVDLLNLVAGLVTPARGVQLAFAAASAAAGYFFAQLASDAPSAEALLKRQEEMVGKIKRAFQDADSDAAKFYRRMQTITLVQAQMQVIDLRAQLQRQAQGFVVRFGAGERDLSNMPGALSQEDIERWQKFDAALADFNRTVEAGAPNIEEFRRQIDVIGRSGDEALKRIARRILDASDDISEIGIEVRRAQEMVNLLEGKTKTAPLLGIGDRKVAAERANEFDRALRAMQRQTVGLVAEAGSFGMAAEAAARYRAEMTLTEAAKRAGLALDPQRLDMIRRESDAYAVAAGRLEYLRERQQAVTQLNDVFKQSYLGLFADFRHGVGAVDAVTNALIRLSDRLSDLILSEVWDRAFGIRRGGGVLGLLGLGGPAFDGAAASRATIDASLPAGFELHRGGVVGAGGVRRVVHPAYFEHAPRLHGGGRIDWAAGERPIVAKVGEVVGWPRQLAETFGGPRVLRVEVVNQSGGELSVIAERPGGGFDARLVVRQVAREANALAAREFREGRGELYGAITQTLDVRRTF